MSEPIVRQRRQNLTDRQIVALPRKRKRYVKADPELRGHYLRVPPSGPITSPLSPVIPYGKQVWATLGTTAIWASTKPVSGRVRPSAASRTGSRLRAGAGQTGLVSRPSPRMAAATSSPTKACARCGRPSACCASTSYRFGVSATSSRIKRRDINELLDSLAKDFDAWNCRPRAGDHPQDQQLVRHPRRRLRRPFVPACAAPARGSRARPYP